MYTAGIVAEFNPFHKGHAYLISQARSYGATHIAVAMSGAAVQRGELAICSKYERAEAAVKNGADLVVELPAPYSCSAARWFADAAVQILGQLGIDCLAFGSEVEERQLLLDAAKACEDERVGEEVRTLSAKGLPYPAALHEAVARVCGEAVAEVISSPNSTLAVEYICALQRQGIAADIMPIKRLGAGHDKPPEGDTASGSYLRKMLLDGSGGSRYIPENALPRHLYDGAAAEHVMYYALLTAERERISKLPEVNELLCDRIINCRKTPPDSLGEFLQAVKVRGFTLARIRRTALQLALGVTAADIIPVPYLHILACSERGREILKKASPSLPISASLKKLEEASPQAQRICKIEKNAMTLFMQSSGRFFNEYQRKFQLIT